MCRLCHAPPGIRAAKATCTRCGHYGTCWKIQRPAPDRRWATELVCYICVAHAHLAAA